MFLNVPYKNYFFLIVFTLFLTTGTGAHVKADHPSFEHNIYPILKLYCLDCHQPGGKGFETSGLDLRTYKSLMKGTRFGSVIVPGDAFSSNLMVVIEGRADKRIKMPMGSYRQQPTRKDRLLIKRWITNGARNSTTFKDKVVPIFEMYCLECHQPGGKGYIASGFNMSTYDSLMKGTRFGSVIDKGDAFTSNLMVVLEGRSNKKIKMPHVERSDLSRWEKHLIRAWIIRGARDN